MNSNNNLDAMNSYPSPLSQLNQDQLISNVDGNSVNGSYINSNTCNNQYFIINNSQPQFQQQQNPFGFNNFHG